MLEILLFIIILFAGIYACIIMDKAKSKCHKNGCKQCGRCHRMREDAEN